MENDALEAVKKVASELEDLYKQKRQIDSRIETIETTLKPIVGLPAMKGVHSAAQVVLPGVGTVSNVRPVAKKKRKLTIEARQKIADAQRRRWAAQNKQKAKA